LTLLGGGAFGNRTEWIFDALDRALDIIADSGLRIEIVSYGKPSPELERFVAKRNRR
jgi:hypothetical protein